MTATWPPQAPLGGDVRVGLAYVRGVRRDEIEALVAARKRAGPFHSLSELASRAGAGAPALELLAWSGACDSLVAAGAGGRYGPGADSGASSDPPAGAPGASPRRLVLWQLGVATPGHSVRGGVQLALPLELPAAPRLRELSGWDAMIADYETAGLTVGAHPLALLRGRVPLGPATGGRCVTADSAGLERLSHGSRVRVGGLVVARQQPGTARGVVFILLEDEHGVINLIVPPKVYERHRLLVRTEPLLVVEGKLERFAKAGGTINVLVDKVGQISAPDRVLAQIKDFSMLDDQVRAAAEREAELEAQREADEFRAVAPPVMNFASGRRR